MSASRNGAEIETAVRVSQSGSIDIELRRVAHALGIEEGFDIPALARLVL
jgi:hypothetical protein